MANAANLSDLYVQELHARGLPWLEETCAWLAHAAKLCGGDLQLALLVLLLRRHAETGTPVTGVRLAHEAGLPRQTVRRKLETLRAMRLVSKGPDGWRLLTTT
ncbi:MAG: hypothetical protein U1E46_10705 [Hyphomicrobiales bacterium]